MKAVNQKFGVTVYPPGASAKNFFSELGSYFLIAIGWSWLMQIPRVLASMEIIILPTPISTFLGHIAVFGPFAASFILTGFHEGKEGLRTLWMRGWDLRIKKIWFVPALLRTPTAGVLTLGLLKAFNQPVAWEAGLPPIMIVPVGLVIWLFGAYPEEFGWRGYALDKLQAFFPPLPASLLLGLLWGLWHLPLHFISGTTQACIPVWEFLMQTIWISIIYTWLHNGSGGSILIASLFHAISNLTGALFPYWTSESGRWVSFAVLCKTPEEFKESIDVALAFCSRNSPHEQRFLLKTFCELPNTAHLLDRQKPVHPLLSPEEVKRWSKCFDIVKERY